MKHSVLEAKNLTKKFKDFTAVNGISFAISEGQIVGLLGPNGAGKTTTIQMLLGVLLPSNGTIHYFGKNLTSTREEILENVNFSTTYTNLPWRLTVRECLTFISYLYTITNRKQRVDEIIEDFKLQELEKKTISQLSAGQRTRVNLAKSFINHPKVLLLDEPTASMDPDIATYLRNLILERKKRLDMSIIWTSHNMAEVEEMCDRVIFINHGKIIADDAPDKLAGSIEICHVDLLIKDGLKRTIEFSLLKKLPYILEGRRIIIDVKEKYLAEFLRELGSKGIHYDEISIEKPTLEDYFLQMSAKKNYEIT
jgi:ABC-2 type transport system ATP-binding protein